MLPFTHSFVRMKLNGANDQPILSGQEKLPGIVNYFVGSDPKRWQTHIPTYKKVAYDEVYPGIDLVYYGNGNKLEYDFIVEPGGDPTQIELAFEGTTDITVDEKGDLQLFVGDQSLRLLKPHVYQEVDGKNIEVEAKYVLMASGNSEPPSVAMLTQSGIQAAVKRGSRLQPARMTKGGTGMKAGGKESALHGATPSVSIQLAAYDRTKSLTIDPVVVYATFLGGNHVEQGLGIAVDGTGAVYATGYTWSDDFNQPCLDTPGCSVFDKPLGGERDVYVVKLNSTGTARMYSTYLGGDAREIGYAVAVDGMGAAYVTGETLSDNYTDSCQTIDGCFPWDTSLGGPRDAFLTKINPSGAGLVFSTYVGGTAEERSRDVAVDLAGNVYITGWTTSTNFTANCTNNCTVMDPKLGTLLTGGGDRMGLRQNIMEAVLFFIRHIWVGVLMKKGPA
jgi:hypothetical protein